MGTISHFDMPSSPYYNTKSKEMGDSKLLDEISKLREWWVEDLKSFTDIKNKTINFKEVIMKNLQNKNKEKGKKHKKKYEEKLSILNSRATQLNNMAGEITLRLLGFLLTFQLGINCCQCT